MDKFQIIIPSLSQIKEPPPLDLAKSMFYYQPNDKWLRVQGADKLLSKHVMPPDKIFVHTQELFDLLEGYKIILGKTVNVFLMKKDSVFKLDLNKNTTFEFNFFSFDPTEWQRPI